MWTLKMVGSPQFDFLPVARKSRAFKNCADYPILQGLVTSFSLLYLAAIWPSGRKAMSI